METGKVMRDFRGEPMADKVLTWDQDKKGKAREVVGKLRNDEDQQAKGQVDQAGGDENAVKDVMLVMQAARRIRDDLGAAVLIVHHTGKNSEAERGSSALRAGADTMLKLSADGKLLKLIVDKQKDAATPRPKMLRLEGVHVSGAANLDDPDPVIDLATSCVLVDADTGTESEEEMPNQRLTANRRKALETLRDAADEWTSTGR